MILLLKMYLLKEFKPYKVGFPGVVGSSWNCVAILQIYTTAFFQPGFIAIALQNESEIVQCVKDFFIGAESDDEISEVSNEPNVEYTEVVHARSTDPARGQQCTNTEGK